MKTFLTFFLTIVNLIVIGQTFNVTNDTLVISLSGLISPATNVELTHAVKFENKFYCFFQEINDNSGRDLKFCFIIANNGNVLQKLNVPNEIQNTVYYDLFLRNDSIFVKTYMDSRTYFLNMNKLEWTTTKEADDIIFEDERFLFTYLDFGEWGKTTWCIDKTSGKEYELSSSGAIINKIGSNYYVTSGLGILKIEDPLKLKPSDNNYYYKIVRKKEHSEGTKSLIGSKVLFRDSTYSYFEQIKPKLVVATSFPMDNKLYHLCSDSTKTFIATLENGSMTPIQIIEEELSTFDWHYSYRNKIQKDNSQLLKFKKGNQFGLICIKGRTINIYHLNLR